MENNSARQRHFGLLILAHNGVYNPQIFTNWLQYINDDRLLKMDVGIFANPVKPEGLLSAREVNNAFTERYDLGIRMKTGWGELSSVKAYQEGLKRMLQLYPSMQYIFLCSGMDIPTLRRKSLNDYDMRSRIYRLDRHAHSQWIYLTRKHAEIVAKENVDTIWKKKPTTVDLNLDEYIPLKILEGQDDSIVTTEQMFGAEYNLKQNPNSPVMWVSWNVPQIITNQSGKLMETTLEKVMLYDVKKGDDVFFYRKVNFLGMYTPSRMGDDLVQNYPWL